MTDITFIITTDPAERITSEPPVLWALDQLKSEFEKQSISYHHRGNTAFAGPNEHAIVIASSDSPLAQGFLEDANVSVPSNHEAICLVPGKVKENRVLLVTGVGVRSLVYGVLELADRVKYADEPAKEIVDIGKTIESPANPIRSVTRNFQSDVEDKPWFNDKAFWQQYLSMLIAQRFNRFNLSLGLGYDRPNQVIEDAYFLFPYPFLVDVPGYHVRAEPLTSEERDSNLAMLKLISEQATTRGLDFFLGIWHQAYDFPNSPNLNYVIMGLTPETHAEYCRDALHTLLKECPAIKGVTFRAHDESGIPDGSYDFWQTVFDGLVRCGRPIEIDLHSKGIDHRLIEIAVDTGLSVNVSTKFSSEHMGLPYHQTTIRAREQSQLGRDEHGRTKRSRSFTRYSYGDYLIEDRSYGVWHRMWPGTQRLLLWGDPIFASAYSRAASFCGSLGMEICEPLSFKGRQGSGSPGGREQYADASLRPDSGDWEKYLYSYRLWGRLLYNPEADPESWRRYLRHEFGEAASPIELALGHASRILPLVTSAHLEAAANNFFWPEMYTNMSIIKEYSYYRGFIDTPKPTRFGNVSPLDPCLFSSIDEFAAQVAAEKISGKYSPLEVASWLEDLAEKAEAYIVEAKQHMDTNRTAAFTRLQVDVNVQSGLGRFFSEKFRAGVSYALYQNTQDLAHLKAALDHYGAALLAWRQIVVHTQNVYGANIAFGGGPDYMFSPAAHRRGHWADRLAAIEQDLHDMYQEWVQAKAQRPNETSQRQNTPFDLQLPNTSPSSHLQIEHSAPSMFRRGDALKLEVVLKDTSSSALATVRLHYRHINQAETFCIQEAEKNGCGFQAVIPPTYTDTSYPLMYYFEIWDSEGKAWLYPGLGVSLSNQPYFVLRQA